MLVMRPEKVCEEVQVKLYNEKKSPEFFKGKKVYIAAPGAWGLREKKKELDMVERELFRFGSATMNPLRLPWGFETEEYLHICRAMIDVCDMIVFLPGWTKDERTMKEHEYGAQKMKTMVSCFGTKQKRRA